LRRQRDEHKAKHILLKFYINTNTNKYEYHNLMYIGPCIIVIVENKRLTWCHLLFLFHFLCAQNISDINISIIKNLRLFCWITTLVVLFLVRCVLEFRRGWVGVVSVLQASACNHIETPTHIEPRTIRPMW